MTAISDLLERVEKATGPDAELDAHVYRLLGGEVPTEFMGTDVKLSWDASGKAWCYLPGGMRVSFTPPALTGSIDAALALVERKLPGFDYILEHTNGGLTISCLLGTADPDKRAFADTAPLAILAALLKALETP